MSLTAIRKAAGQSTLYRENEGNRVVALQLMGGHEFSDIETAMRAYQWKEEDFLLASYPKNGTHLTWEIMMMLLRGKAEYFKESKMLAMIDVFPVTRVNEFIASPRVLNTHYRLNCLPEQFQRKKTVLVIRNPKDAIVSDYYHTKTDIESGIEFGHIDQEKLCPELQDFTFSNFLKLILQDSKMSYGNMLDYLEYMWTLKDDPNMLVLYFEDIKRNPIEEITKLNEFMGTGRDPDLIAEIAEKTNFSKMKKGKEESETTARSAVLKEEGVDSPRSADSNSSSSSVSMYRKGETGDWKNHFTVAENEAFDAMLTKWQKGKNIPFTFE